MGLSEIFYTIMEVYETQIHWDFENTFVLLLYRCMISYASINKLTLIFNMLKKKDQTLINFINANQSEAKEVQSRCEEFLT